MTMLRSMTLPMLLLALLLGACQSSERRTVYRSPEPELAPAPAPAVTSEAIRRARILADMLYEARLAYEDNRLTSPAGNNAYDRFREVLSIEPDNAVAQQGVVDIVLRYIELADVEISQGEYDNAASLIARGANILPERPELADARSRLATARMNKVENHALDPAGLSSQSLEMMTHLAELAQDIRAREATFLINARTDDEGRWIYKVMREAVGGYRLRGNIGISGTPAILITVPANCVADSSETAQGNC